MYTRCKFVHYLFSKFSESSVVSMFIFGYYYMVFCYTIYFSCSIHYIMYSNYFVNSLSHNLTKLFLFIFLSFFSISIPPFNKLIVFQGYRINLLHIMLILQLWFLVAQGTCPWCLGEHHLCTPVDVCSHPVVLVMLSSSK